ncbi:MAG: hypothetical protein WC554_18490, partial [Clostridia bacterium]
MSHVKSWKPDAYEQELTLSEVADQVRAGTYKFEQMCIEQDAEPATHLELGGCSFAASSFNRVDLRLANFQGTHLPR